MMRAPRTDAAWGADAGSRSLDPNAESDAEASGATGGSGASGTRSLVAWPTAKVNLELHVGARRPDGYHEVDTVLQAIDLADRLEVEVVEGGLGIELTVHGAELGPPEENLVYSAARAYMDEAEVDWAVQLELWKGIPAGAGLGGGSADAAATLLALDRLGRGRLGAPRLHELAAALGSDVPFFLADAGRARATGRGERLALLPALPPAALVVVAPRVHVSTAEAYGALGRPAEAATGEDDGLAAGPSEPPDMPTWDDVAARATNDFEPVVSSRHPEVRTALDALRARGPRLALLSGSGAAVFGVFGTWADATAAAAGLRRESGLDAYAVRTRPTARALLLPRA